MKKKIKITNTHRYTKESMIQYHGYVDIEPFENGYFFVFREKDNTKVKMSIYDTYMCIERFGEAQTYLTFKEKQMTKNPIRSVYGEFEIEIYTHKYETMRNHIYLEYDVENGSDDKDGFIIEIEMKEDRHEFH